MPTLREQFSAIERLGNVNYIYPAARSRFYVQDQISSVQGVTFREVFTAADATLERNFMSVRESFRIADDTLPSAIFTWAASDQFKASDATYPQVSESETVRDSFIARESVTSARLRTQLTERFIAREQITPALTANHTVREVFRARGKALPRQQVVVREQFAAVETAYPARVLRYVERDSFIARENLTTSVQHLGRVLEKLVATESTTAVSNLLNTIREQFASIDTTYPIAEKTLNSSLLHVTPLADTDVWTADMMSWGMSRYLAAGVWDFAGTQFAVGQDGVFTASSDVANLAFLRTGDLSFEESESTRGRTKPRSMEKKRINYVYAYASQPSPLTIGVVADFEKVRVGTEYVQPDDALSEDTRAVRTPVGRGYASNYVQLAVGGAVLFDLSSMEVEATVTNRRI